MPAMIGYCWQRAICCGGCSEQWWNGWRLSRSEQGRATGCGDEEIDPRKDPAGSGV